MDIHYFTYLYKIIRVTLLLSNLKSHITSHIINLKLILGMTNVPCEQSSNEAKRFNSNNHVNEIFTIPLKLCMIVVLFQCQDSSFSQLIQHALSECAIPLA